MHIFLNIKSLINKTIDLQEAHRRTYLDGLWLSAKLKIYDKQLVEPLLTNNNSKEDLEDTKQGIRSRGVEIANIFRKVTWHLSKFVKCLISESLKCILY